MKVVSSQCYNVHTSDFAVKITCRGTALHCVVTEGQDTCCSYIRQWCVYCWVSESRMSAAECQSPECLLLSARVQNVYCWVSESRMSTAECQSPECLLLSVRVQNVCCWVSESRMSAAECKSPECLVLKVRWIPECLLPSVRRSS